MDLTVIIATYNRAESLRRTLTGFCSLSVPSTVNWELVVVDNNSTDGTRAMCEEFRSGAAVPAASGTDNRDGRPTGAVGCASRVSTGDNRDGRPTLPLRYLFEPRQGKSRALNRAIAEISGTGVPAAPSGATVPVASGTDSRDGDPTGDNRDGRHTLLVFTDDDVDVDESWLRVLWEAARRHPAATFFGGKVVPRWERPPPRWVAEHSPTLLNGVTVHVDKGIAERSIRVEDGLFFGANMAIRRSAFDQGFRFLEEIGPTAHEPVRGEETELQKQLLQKGHQGVYLPAAIVHHRNPSERATERYVRQWFKGQGMKIARLREVGAPRHLWRKCVVAGAKYALTRWTRPARVWLPAEIEMARTWGMIQECRRLNDERGTKSPRTLNTEH